jgi:hypothetical protein
MANTLTKLAQVQLDTSDGLIYQVPAGTTAVITLITFANTDTSDRTFRFHHVNSAGSSAATNAVYYDYAVAAKRTFVPPLGGMIGTAGQMLRGLASSASKITVTVWGIERT